MITAGLGFISGGGEVALGVKDTPIHISRHRYFSKLHWISTKYVVFWDEETKRGWLVNGTTALLHLVRASLEHSKKDKLSSVFLFKTSQIIEATQSHKPSSAMEVLLNKENLALKLYEDDDVSFSFH